MLSIPGANVRCCDGPTRREFLRVGGATLFGLSLPHFLSWKALASATRQRRSAGETVWQRQIGHPAFPAGRP